MIGKRPCRTDDDAGRAELRRPSNLFEGLMNGCGPVTSQMMMLIGYRQACDCGRLAAA
jgi:hypothetical protein